MLRAVGAARARRSETLAAEAVKYVSANLNRIRAVGQVAGALGVSREHASRSFKRQLGCSIWTFIVALRVERAQKLLSGPLLLKEIAKEVGFGSDSSFLRAFVRKSGMLPSTYRKRILEGALPGFERESVHPDNRPQQADLGE